MATRSSRSTAVGCLPSATSTSTGPRRDRPARSASRPRQAPREALVDVAQSCSPGVPLAELLKAHRIGELVPNHRDPATTYHPRAGHDPVALQGARWLSLQTAAT